MATLERPKLRPLRVQRVDVQGRPAAAFQDPQGAFDGAVAVPFESFEYVIRHFDGSNSWADIQSQYMMRTGQFLSAAELQALIEQLDRAMVLDGPTFATFLDNYRNQGVRPAAHAGRSYAGTERALRAQLGQFFADSRGAGEPVEQPNGSGRLRGVLSPHIDFLRGGPVYTWSYKELVEKSDAEIFVILGVSHQFCRRRFALTRKDFETPLGLARTERSYLDRIAALAGDEFFDDELSHRVEHSVEFQVVFLQYLLGGRRDFSIVPILAGSFHDLMELGIDPIASEDVRRFVNALRAAEQASGKKVAYIGGIDLAHVGRDFGDPDLLTPETLEHVRQFDGAMLERATAIDPAGWFGTAANVSNRWRVCGLAATYTMLHAMGPARGRLLRYDQAVNPQRTCCVSFCSVAYDAEPADG